MQNTEWNSLDAQALCIVSTSELLPRGLLSFYQGVNGYFCLLFWPFSAIRKRGVFLSMPCTILRVGSQGVGAFPCWYLQGTWLHSHAALELLVLLADGLGVVVRQVRGAAPLPHRGHGHLHPHPATQQVNTDCTDTLTLQHSKSILTAPPSSPCNTASQY